MALSTALKHLESKGNHFLHLVLRLNINGAIPSFPDIPYSVHRDNFIPPPLLNMVVIKLNAYTTTWTVREERALVHGKTTTLQTTLPVCKSDKTENKLYLTPHVIA